MDIKQRKQKLIESLLKESKEKSIISTFKKKYPEFSSDINKIEKLLSSLLTGKVDSIPKSKFLEGSRPLHKIALQILDELEKSKIIKMYNDGKRISVSRNLSSKTPKDVEWLINLELGYTASKLGISDFKFVGKKIYYADTNDRGPRIDHGGGESGDDWMDDDQVQKITKRYEQKFLPILKDLASRLKPKGIIVKKYGVDYGEKGHVSLYLEIK